MAEDKKTPTKKTASKKKTTRATTKPVAKKKTVARKKAPVVKKVAPRRATPEPQPDARPVATAAPAPEVVAAIERSPEVSAAPGYTPEPHLEPREGRGMSSILALWGPLGLIVLLVLVTRVGSTPEKAVVAAGGGGESVVVQKDVAVEAAKPAPALPSAGQTHVGAGVATASPEAPPVVEAVTVVGTPTLVSKAEALQAAFRDAGVTAPKASKTPPASAAPAVVTVMPPAARGAMVAPAPSAQAFGAPGYPPLPGPYSNPWAAGAGGAGAAYWGPGVAAAGRGDMPPPPPGAMAGQAAPGYPIGPAARPPMAGYPMPMYYWVPVPYYGFPGR